MPPTRRMLRRAAEQAATSTQPSVGAAVVFAADCQHDFLGERSKAYDSVCLGTIIECTALMGSGTSWQLEVKTPDKQTQFLLYPSRHVSLVYPADPSQPHLFHKISDGEEATVAYNTQPSTLALGDVVYGNYQGGLEGCYYRGRIAQVSQSECDIAYDDGDYERRVPLGKPNVLVWVQDGFTNPSFLQGLLVTLPKLGQGTVVGTHPSKTVTVQFEQCTENVAYSVLIQHLVGDARPRSIDFPNVGIQATPLFPTSVIQRSSTQKRKASTQKTPAPSARTAKVTPGSALVRNIKKNEKADQNDEKLTENKAMSIKSQSLYHRSRAAPKVPLEAPAHDLEPVRAHVETELLQLPKVLQNYDAVTYGNLLMSSETEIGMQLLGQDGGFPDDELRRRFVALLTQGPMAAEEGVIYPDPIKMEWSRRLVEQYFSYEGSKDLFLESLPDDEPFWEQIRTNVTSYYAVTEDINSKHVSAWLRQAHSLDAMAHGLYFFRSLLAHVLRDARDASVDDLIARPLISDIASGRSKEVLQKFVRAIVRLALHYLHLAAPFDTEMPVLPDAHEAYSKARDELGSSITYLAHLHALLASEPVDALVYLLSGTIQREMEQSYFDPEPFLGDHECPQTYKDMVKLEIVLSLDTFIPDLRVKLADSLRVGHYWNMIMH